MKKILFILLTITLCFNTLNAQIDPRTPSKKEVEQHIEKYLAPLPEEDGKVYLVREMQLPANSNAEEVMKKLNAWFDRCMQDEAIIKHIDVPSDQPNTIQHQVIHTITFKDALLSLDQTEMTYVMTVTLKDNVVKLKMQHISYKYNAENPDHKMLRYTAEDHIADRVALNKKHNKLIKGYRKFRVKTVDLMDSYLDSLKGAFWIQ